MARSAERWSLSMHQERTDAARRVVEEIRSAYDGSADGWASGPAAVYRRLAAALIDAAPEPLAGQRVLDVGAGTGVASELLAAAGAHVVGVDLAVAMLAHDRAARPPGVAADAQALPFRTGSFDVVVAAFCINHVPDPVSALAEFRRVAGPTGVTLASTFPNDAEHPAKAVVEVVLGRFGYERPDWYRTMKDDIAPLTGEPAALEAAAAEAGFTEGRVERVDVEAGLDRPELAAAWRLNMPHTIGFLADLDPESRGALYAAATEALGAQALPTSVPILILRGRTV